MKLFSTVRNIWFCSKFRMSASTCKNYNFQIKCTFDLIFEINAYITMNLTPNNSCLAQTVTKL